MPDNLPEGRRSNNYNQPPPTRFPFEKLADPEPTADHPKNQQRDSLGREPYDPNYGMPHRGRPTIGPDAEYQSLPDTNVYSEPSSAAPAPVAPVPPPNPPNVEEIIARLKEGRGTRADDIAIRKYRRQVKKYNKHGGTW